MDIQAYIAKRIKELRESKKISQTDLARQMGVTPNTVSRWESGVYKPSMGDLDRLARAFDRPLSTFLPGDDQVSEAQNALLSATGGLPEEDLEEIRHYVSFIRTRRELRKSRKTTQRDEES